MNEQTDAERKITRDIIAGGWWAPKTAQERRWVKACAAKSWFKTEEHARRNAARHGLEAYRCRYCPHWHLTRRLRIERR